MKEEYTAMNTRIPRTTLLARLLLTLGCTTTGLVSTAQADVQGLDLPVPVAQEPIGRSTGLPPNVVFMMDDSASMCRQFIPDNLKGQIESVSNPPRPFSGNNDGESSPPWYGIQCGQQGWFTAHPYGHLYQGRLWFDSNLYYPINTIAFKPYKDYPARATGEPAPAAGKDVPRIEMNDRQFMTDAKFVDWEPGNTWGAARSLLPVQMAQRIRNHASDDYIGKKSVGPLPPLLILRHNEQNIKNAFGGQDNARQAYNYFVIEFLVHNGNYRYDHTEVRAIGADGNWDLTHPLSQEYGNNKAWPDNKEFVFIDKNGKELRRIKPRELFINYRNFLRWYNSRAELAKTAVIEAFATRDEKLRAGFSTIGKGVSGHPTTSPTTATNGLRFRIPVGNDDGLFRGKNRTEFFNQVLNFPQSGETPLRRGLHELGQYYSDYTSADSPYKGRKSFSCRQNLAIIASDGYYNDHTSGWGDWDSTRSSIRHEGMNGEIFQYSPYAPYQDGAGVKYEDTMADIAMYYWLNDLVPDSAGNIGTNNVPATGNDPAFWQHMRTYSIAFGAAGSLDETSPAPGLPGSSANKWPKPVRNAASASDDLWHAAVNGRGGYYSVDDSFGLSEALKKILAEANPGSGPGSTSAANNYLFLDRESGNVLQFSSTYNASSLSSNLVACPLKLGCKAGGVSWSAGARLNELLQGNLGRERTIVFNPGSGSQLLSFQWGNLSAAQQQALAGGNEELGKDTVRYLRGDTSLDGQTITNPDTDDPMSKRWRVRADLGGTGRNVLGMVVHGTPTFIGAPEDIRTELNSTLSGYGDFKNDNKNRPGVLYVAANDGMVHAFITERKTVPVTAGGITTTATFEQGDELFAFIPAAAINKNMRDFTRPPFEHTQHYLLDGELNYSEVKLGGEWKTVLVGSMGTAGVPPNATPAVFALDVTNPGNPKLLWEVTAPAMGQTMGRPVIAPMADGKWSVFIGSGPNQSETRSHSAILQIDLETGIVTTLQSGEMASVNNGGILGLHVVDADHDNYADTIYAGDLGGNLWKVTNIDGKAAGGVQYVKLFQANKGITAAPTSTLDKKGVRWLYFGTGRALTDDDLVDTSSQHVWYGIQDNDELVKEDELVTRNYDVIKDFKRDPSDSDGTDAVVMRYAVAGDMDGKKGWRVPLNQSSDAEYPGYMVLQSRIRNGFVVGQMNFSAVNEPSCEGLTSTSRLMVLDPFTGAVSPDNPNGGNIDVNDDEKVDEKDLYSGSSSLGGGGAGGTGPLPIVGLGFGTGELSGSILIVQEQRTKPGSGSSTTGDPKDEIESTRSCALDANGVRVCLPPNPTGKPPSTHTWSELRYDDAP